MIFFTADTHFSDALAMRDGGIITRDNRPFDSVNQMDESIINIWNSQASQNDVIYHLGDFINYNSIDKVSYPKALSLVKRINAKIILVMGNQEQRLMRERFDNDFDSFSKYMLSFGFYEIHRTGVYLTLRGKRFYLNHFPSLHDPDADYNLFGHVHSLCLAKKYGYNVGVDCKHFRLFSIDRIFRYIDEAAKYYGSDVYE